MDKIYNKTIINVGSVGNAFDVIRNKNKDSDVLETTKSNYLIIEGEYGSREYSSYISFQFIKVPYDIDRELEDENLNIEKENYRDCLCDFVIICINGRCCSCNCRTTTDGRSDANQSRDVARNMHDFMQHIGKNQRSCDCGYNDRK